MAIGGIKLVEWRVSFSLNSRQSLSTALLTSLVERKEDGGANYVQNCDLPSTIVAIITEKGRNTNNHKK